jgi:hypothetical protein
MGVVVLYEQYGEGVLSLSDVSGIQAVAHFLSTSSKTSLSLGTLGDEGLAPALLSSVRGL